MDSFVILLTGTIKPIDVPSLKMISPILREMEYFKAIKKWLSLGHPVIFCENSNFNSDLINNLYKSLSPEKFEYLKFSTNCSFKGKGNGEAELLNYVFENSALIANADWICKATGKNYIKNAKHILYRVSADEYKKASVISNISKNLSFADSRFFLFKYSFYFASLKKNLATIDEENGLFFEHALAKSVHYTFLDNEQWKIIPLPPIIEGYYGTLGIRYKNNFIKNYGRYVYHELKKSILRNR